MRPDANHWAAYFCGNASGLGLGLLTIAAPFGSLELGAIGLVAVVSAIAMFWMYPDLEGGEV